ncbi:MAG: UDP-N-acetylmuramoyl-L-alanine--D-glutamate ligase [Candidatus Uhrbacteria bacterium]|nr:UDP-N-acetylmuramoyl-L-alanine--D-glutamate ligase [Candidatus Uhrbacteria bacterium]
MSLLHAPFTRTLWKDKRVLILGLGQYPKGSGVSAALAFAKLGAKVVVTDEKEEADLKANVDQLRKYKNVRFVLGKHELSDIDEAEIVVANPRVRPTSPMMQRARKKGIPVTSDIALFLDRCPAQVVAITGTRGKSTTTTLIAEMLKASGKKVWLGGNILVSPLTFVSKVKAKDIVVLELSSWQCESLGMSSHQPHVSVVTNLMRDHLNAYEGMEDYAEAKAQIFRHQGPDDVVIFNADDALGNRWTKEAPGRVLTFGKKGKIARVKNGVLLLDGKEVIKETQMQLMGEHNVMNALAAMVAAREAGASIKGIKTVLKTFKGLENRLQVIREHQGVTYINDTTATTPDAAIAACKAMLPRANFLFFIMGGADKELEYAELGVVLKKAKKRIGIFLFPGKASEKMVKEFNRNGIAYEEVGDMKTAVQRASEVAQSGDAIILSSAAASFGLFKNEFDRGEQFVKAVKHLK